MLLIIYVLFIFMIIGALVAIETRDLLSSVCSVGAVGFGVTTIFLLMGAPDIAITQVVVEIICLVILLRATVTRDDTSVQTHRDMLSIMSVLVFAGLFLAFLFFALKDFPAFGAPVMQVGSTYLEKGLSMTGAPNTMTAIMLDFRGYDTMARETVIFTAVIGVYIILRRKGRIHS